MCNHFRGYVWRAWNFANPGLNYTEFLCHSLLWVQNTTLIITIFQQPSETSGTATSTILFSANAGLPHSSSTSGLVLSPAAEPFPRNLRTANPTTRDQLAYTRLRKLYAMEERVGWIMIEHSIKAEVDPSLRWNTLLPGLLASMMLGHGTGEGALFCTMCRDIDHTHAQCALLCAHLPTAQAPTATSPVPRR